MPARRTFRIAVAAAAIVTTALTTASLTYAATSATPPVVKACVSSKGVLSLLSVRGKCAHGTRAVSIDQQGRTGATGKTGARGAVGAAGPRPISIALDTTAAAATSKTVAIGSTGITVAGHCYSGGGVDGEASELLLTGTSDYYVHGAAQYVESGSSFPARTELPGSTQPVPAGASLIAYESNAASAIVVYDAQPVVKPDGVGQLYANLVVLAGDQSFSIHLYEFFDDARCQLSAQVIAP